MNLEIPDEIIRALETKVPPHQVEGLLRTSLAIGLFKADELPWAKAVQLARVDEDMFRGMVEKAWRSSHNQAENPRRIDL